MKRILNVFNSVTTFSRSILVNACSVEHTLTNSEPDKHHFAETYLGSQMVFSRLQIYIFFSMSSFHLLRATGSETLKF